MVTYQQFLDTIFGQVAEGEMILVSHPHGNSHAQYPYTPALLERQEAWYFCISTVKRAAPAKRRKGDCCAMYLIVLDDIGGKYGEPPLEPSYKLETSENNYQWGYLLAEPAADEASMTVAEDSWRGLCDAGYSDQVSTRTRVVRLPGSLHRTGFIARLVEWNPERTFTPEELLRGMGATARSRGTPVPKVGDDPLVPWLIDNMGARDGDPMTVICPWAAEHTDGRPDAGYWPLGANNRASRGFKCLHSHCSERDTEAFLDAVAAAGGPRYSTTGDAEVPAHWRDAIPRVRREVLPNLRITAKEQVPSATQMATPANIEAIASAIGMQCRYNMMTKDVELTAPWHWSPQTVRVELHGACMQLGITNRAAIDDAIAAMAQERRYHPLADQIRATEWDGRDRWAEFARTVGVAEGQDPELPAILLRRWVLQAVKAWTTTTPIQVGGVLVLVGPQYRGKSRWCKKLTPYRCRDGLIAPHHKDSVLQALQSPVFEMSELEGTFRKSDIAALKAFLTQEEDVLRVPYARMADKWPRQTVFAASVNEQAFLVDTTGNRRFWCIEVDRMDADHDVDMLQLYAQALAELEDGAQWWLTEDEHILQMEAAQAFTAPDMVEDLYRDYIDKRLRLPKTSWSKINITGLARLIGMDKVDSKNLGRLKNLVVQEFGPVRQWGSRKRKGWRLPITAAELQAMGLPRVDEDE